MYQEYLDFYKTYTQKYGPKTAIFLLVGSFYELYDIQNRETGETWCNVKEIVDYLGIQLSVKKDSPLGLENCDGLFAGFPDYVLHKWAGRLTSTGWTVVIVDQVKDARGKVKERKVSRILSPSTHIENIQSNETPYVVTLYFDDTKQGHPPIYGAAVLDLTTGRTITYSGKAHGHADIWTADDLVQLLNVFQPKEILIYWSNALQQLQQSDAAFFRRIFGIGQQINLHIRKVETLGAFSKELVRSEYLQKIYSIRSVLPPKTFLGLRTDMEELALLFLLQFAEEHYPSMLKSFHRNEPWNPEMRLICGNHALTQLQMTGNNLTETVIGLFDKCITPMGKRAIKDRLLSPYSDATEIQNRLKEVKEYICWTDDVIRTLEKQLRFMSDLPRLHRKVLCGLITPQEIVGLFQTYSAIEIIMLHVTHNTCLKEPYSYSDWNKYIKVFKANFTEDKALNSTANMTAFNIEKFTEIGVKEREIYNVLNEFQLIRKEIATLGGVSEEALRLEEREKEPFGIKCSSVTLQQLKKNIKNLPEGTKISELKSGGWIECQRLHTLNTKLQQLQEKLAHLVAAYMVDACLEISEAGAEIWTTMEQWVCHIDSTQCIGRTSKERGFFCPSIIEPDEDGSGFEIKSIRHPLVEVSATRVAYVKHDISLGYTVTPLDPTTQDAVAQSDPVTNGWLVYGMNASGKSTLMKATGLCVLLAQAGCFVPAREMTLKPFKAVYTRILNQDNLFAGLSSFAVEMSELRDILRNANKYSLILGDELCAGTESISAQALIASGIQWLSERKAKFIFATHLHDLPQIIDTRQLGVDVWHLHVHYDPITKKLVYDRTLRAGSGSTLYGLEVARAMDLPSEFIEQALKNRHKIIGSKIQMDATQSAWNGDIVRKECEICHKQITNELEVHHIKPRASAKDRILEDGAPMNDKRNLIVICGTCHDKVHAGSIVVGEIKTTSDGNVREIKEIKEINDAKEIKEIDEVQPNHKKCKWAEDELLQIKAALNKYKTLSLKSIRAHLSSKYKIEISETMLGKIRKEI